MLQNAYFLAKIGADTAENEQHFAEILPTDALWRRRHSRFGSGDMPLHRAAGAQAAELSHLKFVKVDIAYHWPVTAPA